MLKNHVLGVNKKQPDGSYARQPQVRVRFQLLENLGTPHLWLEACHSTANFSWGPLVLGLGGGGLVRFGFFVSDLAFFCRFGGGVVVLGVFSSEVWEVFDQVLGVFW